MTVEPQELRNLATDPSAWCRFEPKGKAVAFDRAATTLWDWFRKFLRVTSLIWQIIMLEHKVTLQSIPAFPVNFSTLFFMDKQTDGGDSLRNTI